LEVVELTCGAVLVVTADVEGSEGDAAVRCWGSECFDMAVDDEEPELLPCPSDGEAVVAGESWTTSA
jgi:hypothetical protein